METIAINGTPRTELGKKATRALRKAGNVPCNLYGGKETLNFYAPVSAFKKLIYTPEFRLAEISLGGKTYKAILKESQFEPVKDALLHIDFQELVDNVKVKVNVPLHLTGTPKGVANGGKLEQVLKRVSIIALPKDLPSHITVDVSAMDNGDIKRLRDITVPGVTFLLADSNPLARVNVPRQVKEDAAAAAAPAAAPAAAAPAADAKKDDKKK
ncbi:MAG: 50S ribosomal protein L25 [Bacteroidetes bacterium]|nr:50S ribosomal protein L25 [Bacteroidota bacterium]